MAISLDTSASAYIQKTSGGDLQFTLTGFNNLPSPTSYSDTKSYLSFACEFVYPSGISGDTIESIEVYFKWNNITVTGDGDIVALLQFSRLDELTFDDGNVYGKINNDDYNIYAYDAGIDADDWTGGHYLDWRNATQMSQGRFHPHSGGSPTGSIDLVFKDDSYTVVEQWDNWDGGLVLTRTNGPGGGALNTGSNFTYSGLSTSGGSGGASGDPHINTFGGDNYTL